MRAAQSVTAAAPATDTGSCAGVPTSNPARARPTASTTRTPTTVAALVIHSASANDVAGGVMRSYTTAFFANAGGRHTRDRTL
jgi:hypothetical protein